MKKNKIISILIIIITVFCIFHLTSSLVNAQTIVPETNKRTGNYNLNDFLLIGVNLSKFILGIVGSLTLLMFIYGGFVWILSGGNSERVEKGRQIIISTLIGLIIVFTSYMTINFVMKSLSLGVMSLE